jgi:type VI secretion system protein ImpD
VLGMVDSVRSEEDDPLVMFTTLKEFERVIEAEETVDEFAVDRVISHIDALISAQIDEIMLHAKFKTLEASWRGLWYLVKLGDDVNKTGDDVDRVQIRLLSATWREVCRDLERASSFDQSCLFQKIYEQEFGRAGGEPFGLLLGDYRVSHVEHARSTIDDIAALGALSEVAAAAFAPFITAASPELLGVDSFTSLRPAVSERATGLVGLVAPNFLNDMRLNATYKKWRELRAEPESRYLGVVLPDFLIRGQEYSETTGQRFLGRFQREAPGGEDLLWGSGVYAFGATVIACYGRTGWFTDMRGVRRDDPGSGLVPGLPTRAFATDAPGVAEIPPIEIEIDQVLAAALDEAGLIAILRATGTADLLFDSNCSLYSPPVSGSPSARSSARLSSMLQYVLCVSRFAHYLKVLGRDQIGVRATAASCQDGLQRWIRQYTTSDNEATPARLAERPLRDAMVQVQERPGHPGSFICTAQLKPHFQLDQIISSYEIVTDLAGPAVG